MTGQPFRPAKGGDGKRARKRLSTAERQSRDQANAKIGERIKYVRTEIAGYRRRLEFAQDLGVTRGAVGNWELGQGITRENLFRIAAMYDVSHQWLATGDGIVQPGATDELANKLVLLPPTEQRRFILELDALLAVRLKSWEQENSKGGIKSKKLNIDVELDQPRPARKSP